MMKASHNAPRDFAYGEDEQFLRDVARKMLGKRLPTDRLRELVAAAPEPVYDRGERAPWDPQLWRDIVELGWTGLAAGEAEGGSDFSLVGIAGLLEEVGRYALPAPLLPTLASSLVLRAAGTDQANASLTRIAADGAAASLALTDDYGRWEPLHTPLVAREAGDELIIDGVACFVQDALKADFLVASASLGEEIVLFTIDTAAPGLTLTADHIHDLTRDQASATFEGVQVEAESIVARDAAQILTRAWTGVLLLVSADLCGASEWLLQTTTEYARQRVQFDRPIGFFQAVKHPLVDAMIAIDRARSLLYHACAEVDAGSQHAEVAARMAKSAASDAAAFISDRAVQLHGGIGFTWEYAIHIYFKRNLHNQVLYGDGAYQRTRLAELLIGPIVVSADTCADGGTVH